MLKQIADCVKSCADNIYIYKKKMIIYNSDETHIF